MSIDFCAEPFLEKCLCNRACLDSHGAENLISLDPKARNNGVILEGFSSLPVDITFVFKFPVNVAGVKVHPRILNHRTTCMELSILSERDHTFSLGKTKLPQADFYHFENSLFTPRRNVVTRYGLGSYKCTESTDGHLEESRLLKYRFGVKGITLRLWNGQSPRSPGLARVEIWGQPAKVTDDAAVFDIVDAMIRHQKSDDQSRTPGPSPRKSFGHFLPSSSSSSPPPSLPCTSSSSSHTSMDVSNSSQDEDPAQHSIFNSVQKLESVTDLMDAFPDFFDPITYELMTYPILLPSGYTVDKSTLEKYCDEEMRQNRNPNDPFTRTNFEGSFFPVPNTTLKDRIDDVLKKRQECGLLLDLGRSIGSQKASSHIHTSNLVPVEPMSLGSPSASSSSHSPSTSQSNHDFEESGAGSDGGGAKRLKINESGGFFSMGNHEEDMKRSLEDSISAVLSSGPSLSSGPCASFPPQPPIFSTSGATKCGYCESESNLYGMTCGHLICRQCLVLPSGEENDYVSCRVPGCQQPKVKRGDVIKVHK